MGMRTCVNCGGNISHRHYHATTCGIHCRRERSSKKAKEKRQASVRFRKCIICEKEFLVRHIRSFVCYEVECQNEKGRRWRRAYNKQEKEKRRRWAATDRERHRERIRANHKAWRDRNRDHVRLSARENYWKNIDRERDRSAARAKETRILAKAAKELMEGNNA